MSGEAPDIREQEDCPSNTICRGTCDQHSPLRPDDRAALVAPSRVPGEET